MPCETRCVGAFDRYRRERGTRDHSSEVCWSLAVDVPACSQKPCPIKIQIKLGIFNSSGSVLNLVGGEDHISYLRFASRRFPCNQKIPIDE